MNKKTYTTLVIILLGILLTCFFLRSETDRNLNPNNEVVLLNNHVFNNKEITLANESVIEGGNLPTNIIKLNIDSKQIILDRLLPAGYNSTNIKESFVFNSNISHQDYIIVITSWDSYNRALNTSGLFYGVLVFDQKLKHLVEVEESFFDFDVTDNEKERLNEIRGNKEQVTRKLQELQI
jgi:hypothetical protein